MGFLVIYLKKDLFKIYAKKKKMKYFLLMFHLIKCLKKSITAIILRF